MNCHNSQLIASLNFMHASSPIWKCKTPYLHLRFSVHSMSLIFGLEFVDLDLVIVAFVNVFSSDDSIRKWDYVPPTIFKHALEVVFYITVCFWYMIFVHIHCSIIISYFFPSPIYSSLSYCSFCLINILDIVRSFACGLLNKFFDLNCAII